MRVAILGCTGSIGTQTLDVCRAHPDKLKVVALTARASVEGLVKAAREFGAEYVGLADESLASNPLLTELPKDTKIFFGESSNAIVSTLPDVDCVVNALVGNCGIRAGYEALAAGKRLAYANKESIVSAGDLLMPLAEPGQLIPVDSEHSAIYECLVGEKRSEVSRIWLTCSGGPFFGSSREQLRNVTAAEALAHPTWRMGAKITIDCATLMNKGLEVIEAHQLFSIPADDIVVLVHRQSRIHSMVEFADGAVKAQLGPSDMRIPIQYALSYPERWKSPAEAIDYCAEPPLSFARADEDVFGCLALAREAGRVGGTLPCAMNAANEVANAAFRSSKCGFLDIERIVGTVMDQTNVEAVENLEQLEDVDLLARSRAEKILGELMI